MSQWLLVFELFLGFLTHKTIVPEKLSIFKMKFFQFVSKNKIKKESSEIWDLPLTLTNPKKKKKTATIEYVSRLVSERLFSQSKKKCKVENEDDDKYFWRM